jgi:hypothetical protein
LPPFPFHACFKNIQVHLYSFNWQLPVATRPASPAPRLTSRVKHQTSNVKHHTSNVSHRTRQSFLPRLPLELTRKPPVLAGFLLVFDSFLPRFKPLKTCYLASHPRLWQVSSFDSFLFWEVFPRWNRSFTSCLLLRLTEVQTPSQLLRCHVK